jgi:hypothetical protein
MIPTTVQMKTMMKRTAMGAGKYAALAVMIGLLIPSVARADEFRCTGVGPAAVIPPTLLAIGTINGVQTNITSCIVTDGKQSTLTATIFSASATAEVRAVLNSDPFISFGATINKLHTRYDNVCIPVRDADCPGIVLGSDEYRRGKRYRWGRREYHSRNQRDFSDLHFRIRHTWPCTDKSWREFGYGPLRRNGHPICSNDDL